MKRALLLLAVGAALVAVAAPSWAQAPHLWLSWGSCDHAARVGSVFLGTAGVTSRVMNVVVAATNITSDNSGHDCTIVIRAGNPDPAPAGIPDCWRFDAAGCQTGSQLQIQASGFSKSCPVLQGVAPLAITNFGYDVTDGHVDVRLANTYNSVLASPATVYTMWQVKFDHSFTDMVDPVNSPDSCAGGQEPIVMDMSLATDFSPRLLTTAGPFDFFDELTAGDWHLDMNATVPTRPMSWSKVKGLYR